MASREDREQLRRDAVRLIQDEATARVLGYVRNHVVASIENSEHGEADLREHCYDLLRALRKIDRMLKQVAGEGKLERVRIERSGGTDAAA